jgi:DNA end-binding protein Ku
MPRALWKGAVSFGLVYIPVQLHSASQESTLPLHLLDKRDFAPVGYRRTNKQTGKEVEWQNIIKGYEYEKGKYVALSEADFRQANVKASYTIDIVSFTERHNIPPEFYETPYYLAPDRGGDKVYALLREALLRTQRVAVASIVMHGRQHLVALGADERMLKLNTLRFVEELRSTEGLEVPARGAKAAGINARELSMAEKLVEEMSAPFEPQQFRDTYRDDLMKRIEEKIRKGQTHELTTEGGAEEPRTAQVIDLMAALKKSLQRRGEKAPEAGGSGQAKSAPVAAPHALRTRRKAASGAHRKRA